jgi:putative FmdB family regulatory protein
MPIYEIHCRACGHSGEVMVARSSDACPCPCCGARDTERLMSAPSSLSGAPSQRLPGPDDAVCCGQHPRQAGCDGPGSCCGRRPA